jgi:hypothetical protein
MNHSLRSSCLRADSFKAPRCRASPTPSRVRREALAERLENQWREIRRHATIEKDPGKMLRLTSQLDQRKNQTELLRKHHRELEIGLKPCHPQHVRT